MQGEGSAGHAVRVYLILIQRSMVLRRGDEGGAGQPCLTPSCLAAIEDADMLRDVLAAQGASTQLPAAGLAAAHMATR